MESKTRTIEFAYGDRCVKLDWDPSLTSNDMAIDSIDELGKIFLDYFESTFINFMVLNKQNASGHIVSIDEIITQRLSQIYVRAPEGLKNKNHMKFPPPPFASLHFTKTRNFTIHNCRLKEVRSHTVSSSPCSTEFTAQQVSTHNKPSDCWIILNNKVFNITQYISKHPGGKILLKAAGKDAGQLINQYHPWVSAEYIIKSMQIGTLKNF